MENPNTPELASLLRRIGLNEYAVLYQSYAPDSFGDGEVIFGHAPICLRFLFDRGQQFLQIAFAPHSGRFYQFDDVRLAFGWTTLEEMFAREDVEALDSQLADLEKHMDFLHDAAMPDRVAELQERLAGAARLRADAVRASLGMSSGRCDSE